MSSSAWGAIQGDLRSVRVEWMRCPDAPTAVHPGTTRAPRGRLARRPLSPWVTASGGRRRPGPDTCSARSHGSAARRTCPRAPRRNRRRRPIRPTLCRRLRRPLPSRRTCTHGHRKRSGPCLRRCERPRLASWHNAGQHGHHLVPLSRISPMVRAEGGQAGPWGGGGRAGIACRLSTSSDQLHPAETRGRR